MLTLSQRLRALRQERGLTQTQVGEALGVGKMTVSQLEKGLVALTSAKLAKLAQLYGLSMAELCAFQPAPVASQQIQVVEHLLARLAAAEREIKQKDQTLSEMSSFFTDLNQLLRDVASPDTNEDGQLKALMELVQKFGQPDVSSDSRIVQRFHPVAVPKKKPKDLRKQVLQLLLRGIGLSFLAQLEQAAAKHSPAQSPA